MAPLENKNDVQDPIQTKIVGFLTRKWDLLPKWVDNRAQVKIWDKGGKISTLNGYLNCYDLLLAWVIKSSQHITLSVSSLSWDIRFMLVKNLLCSPGKLLSFYVPRPFPLVLVHEYFKQEAKKHFWNYVQILARLRWNKCSASHLYPWSSEHTSWRIHLYFLAHKYICHTRTTETSGYVQLGNLSFLSVL